MRKNRVETNNIKQNILKKHIIKTNNPNTLTMKSLKTTLAIAILGLFTSNMAFSQNAITNQPPVSYDELREDLKKYFGSEEAYLNDFNEDKTKKAITKKQNITITPTPPIEDPSIKEQEAAKANQKAAEKERITAEEQRKAAEKSSILEAQNNAKLNSEKMAEELELRKTTISTNFENPVTLPTGPAMDEAALKDLEEHEKHLKTTNTPK